jgi:hypothetical protein
MVASRDPDAAERFKWRYDKAVSDFANGGSEAVFRASLFCLGYRGQMLDLEVQHQYTFGIRTVLKRSEYKGGLPDRVW